MMLSSIKFSLIIKQIFKVEPGPGQSDGSGSETLAACVQNNRALPAITVLEGGLSRKEHCPGPDISFWKVRKLGHPPHPPHPCELALCPRGREFCGQRARRIRWISAGREPIGSEWYVWIT